MRVISSNGSEPRPSYSLLVVKDTDLRIVESDTKKNDVVAESEGLAIPVSAPRLFMLSRYAV
jgi:hypothetical protein